MRDDPEQDLSRPFAPAAVGRAALAALAAAGLLAAAPLRAADPPAGAGCLSDATRAAAAREHVPEDKRDRLAELFSQAESAAKAGNGGECRARADEALSLAGLPKLAPVLLSTSMAGETRGAEAQVPAPPAPGSPAGSTASSAADAAPPASQPATAAVQPAPTPAAPEPSTSAPSTSAPAVASAAPSDAWLITSSDLLGKRVVSQSNTRTELGVIENLILEGAAGGRVRYVVIRPPGPFGTTLLPSLTGSQDVIVPLEALRFSGRGEMARLDASPEKLRDAPGFHDADVERLRNDPAWQRGIATYFGVDAEPRQEAAASVPSQAAAPARAAPAPAAATSQQAAAPAATPAATPAAASASAPAGQADAAHGKAVAGRVCTACHSLDQGGQVRVGPPLWGVDGRNIASVQGFSYSGALRSKDGAWDDAKLNAFLKSPRGWAPGTRMAYPGISNDRDRADVVAYLNQLK